MSGKRLFADECCARSLVTALRRAGCDVLWAVEDGAGLPDRAQARRAHAEGRIAISADYDFAELAVRGIEPFIGLMMLAPDLEMEGLATEALSLRILSELKNAPGKVLVFETGRVRRRPL